MENLSLTIFFGGASYPVALTAQTTNSTHIQIVFSQAVNITTAGWSFEKNGGALALTSVAGTGTNTATFLVGTIAYGDVITYSYNSATGSTVSAVTGLELQSVTDVSVTNNVTPIVPTVLTAETIDTTHIQIVFSESMSVTTAGWSFKINGGALAITSVAGATDTWSFLVATMAAGDTLLWSYDATTGNTVSSGTSVELASATDQSVDNNISAGAVQVQFVTAPNVDNATFTSNNTAGNLLVAWWQGRNGLFGASATDTQGNTWLTAHQQNDGFGTALYIMYAYNCAAGANTVTFTGILASYSCQIAEYSGVKSSGDPLLDDGGATGTASPLQDSLTTAVNALIINAWQRQGLDDYTGLVSGTTLINHETGASAFSVQAENLNQAPGTFNVGVTTGGDSENLQASAAFELV